MNPQSTVNPSQPIVFRKHSLVEQSTEALRSAIVTGILSNPLPGENQLAKQLNISRPSLRAALRHLRDEGLIETSKGKRSRILTPTSPSPSQAPILTILRPSTPHNPTMHAPLLQELQQRAVARGMIWEEIHNPSQITMMPSDANTRRVRCLLAVSSTPNIQQWLTQQPFPALILGSCHKGISLPSIDLDHHAIGWHAAGTLARLGHSRISVILPETPLAGDLANLQGMLDYARQRRQQILEVRVSADIQSLHRQLTRQFQSNAAPTALFSLRSAYSVALAAWLPSVGKTIPEDIALISRDTHPLIDIGLPHLSRYDNPIPALVNKAFRTIERILSTGSAPTGSLLIIPRFINGQSSGEAIGGTIL